MAPKIPPKRTKPHVNIGTIGHVDQNKPSKIDKAMEQVEKRIREFFSFSIDSKKQQ